jgi:hypothetical protein
MLHDCVFAFTCSCLLEQFLGRGGEMEHPGFQVVFFGE